MMTLSSVGLWLLLLVVTGEVMIERASEQSGGRACDAVEAKSPRSGGALAGECVHGS